MHSAPDIVKASRNGRGIATNPVLARVRSKMGACQKGAQDRAKEKRHDLPWRHVPSRVGPALL